MSRHDAYHAQDETAPTTLADDGATECRRCSEIEPCDERGLCASCIATIRVRIPEARL